jgi:hypothetical protein
MEKIISGEYRKKFYRDPVNCKIVVKTQQNNLSDTTTTPWNTIQDVINEFCGLILKINVEQRHFSREIIAVIETEKFNYKKSKQELLKWWSEHSTEFTELKIFCDQNNLNKYFN